jgi:hypothetical protein
VGSFLLVIGRTLIRRDNTPMMRLIGWSGVLVLALLCAGAWGQACPVTPANDALRQIIQCLAGQDCRGRGVTETQNLGPGCEREIEVWSWHSGRQSVAIRDRKMCLSRRRAQPDMRFVHGLLLPLRPLCGVEDPQLYAADSPSRPLWRDAWDAARLRLPEEEAMLVINPPTLRSQTHLHIHIVRSNGVAFPAANSQPLAGLDEVWNAARAFARDRLSITDGNYGVALRKHGAGFEMLVEAGLPVNMRNPESRYGIDED